MKVVARFQNTTDVTGPYNGEEQKLNVKINAEQGTGTDGMETTYTGTVYRNNSNYVYNNVNLSSYVYADSSGSMGPSDSFETEEDCVEKYPSQGTYYCQAAKNILGNYTEDASTLGKQYYLKHDIVDDIIRASYVCFVYNNAEHCMKGADGGASFAANTQTIRDFQAFYNLNTVSNPSSSNPGCLFNSDSRCNGGGFYLVIADSGSGVDVSVSSSEYCFVGGNGCSRCFE